MRIRIAALLLAMAAGATAQTSPKLEIKTVPPRPDDVATIDGMIKAYYEVVSGPKGQPRVSPMWGRSLLSPTRLAKSLASAQHHTNNLWVIGRRNSVIAFILTLILSLQDAPFVPPGGVTAFSQIGPITQGVKNPIGYMTSFPSVEISGSRS